MRDLFVFLCLFILGLAIWTTGLYPAGPVQATTPIQDEIEHRTAAIARPAQQNSLTPDRDEPSPPESLEDTSASSAGAATSSSRQVGRRVSQGARETSVQPRSEPAIQRISIPFLKIEATVVEVPFNGETWDISTLGQDIARLGEIPGESAGKNIILAGHFTVSNSELGPFRYISRLPIGERILVYTDRMTYTYQVREHALVSDRDERVYAPTSEAQLTLLTCETWDESTGKFLRRRVVFADLVRSEPLSEPSIQ